MSRDTAPAAPSSPTRVLMVLDSFSFGGAENLVAELGRYGPASLRITAASLAPAAAGRNEMLSRLEAAGLDPAFLSVRRLLDPRGFINLVRALRHSDADVIHAHLGYSATLVPLAARLAGKPVVATLHLSPQRHNRRAEWFKEHLAVRIPARLGRLVLVSQHGYDDYARVHGPATDSWRVIRNGIDVRRYRTRRMIRSAAAPVWASIAALRPDKNHLDLVRAWAGVVAEHPRARLLIVGEGPMRTDIEIATAAAGLRDSIKLLGRREDVPDILSAVDGVVSASVDEALPTALIEAAACGLPVVAADAGGTSEVVVDGVTGRLVPLRDVHALTRALLDIIGDPDQAARYGAAGRARAEEMYSMPRWTERLSELYAEVLDDRR